MKEIRYPDTYERIEVHPLPDLKSQGYIFRHKKSGAHLAVISNDDENKVFYAAFRTPVSDSTGVAHIIEHTVLCGSEKYPVKDPFVELVKGSLNTFLNAMTYPDKTVYPIASTNDKDFQNLMGVYMDAVFHPNIYHIEKIFRQEGWHYELDDPEGEITINGVVYNEMKGAFSSPEDVLDRLILNSLHPDTNYGFESGGDPEDIPSLTYENYLNFHRRFYHPSNSYLYLYGDMDIAEKLEWLDREYLSKYDAISPDSEIPCQEPFSARRELSSTYNIASTEEEEDNAYLALNFSVGEVTDLKLVTAFDILDYALLSRPGAPLKQALLDAGIGKDIMGGFDAGIRQPMFSIVAKNANAEQKDMFLSVIEETLQKEAKKGLSEKTLLAAINSSEFRFREADFGSYPKGLIYGLDMLESWIYDEKLPFLMLEVLPVYAELRKEIGTGYFEGLIRTWLLENPFSTLVTVSPEKGLLERKEKAQRERLSAYKESLSEEEIKELIESTRELKAYQDEPSPEEELEKIPMLRREDIEKKIRPIQNREGTIGGEPAVIHEMFTNGIAYIRLLFDTADLTEEELPYAGLLPAVLGYMDTEGLSFTELSDEINLYTGGIGGSLSAVNKRDENETKEYYEVKAKCLYGNIGDTMRLLTEIFTGTDFTDEKRLHEILSEARSRLEMMLPSGGNATASMRAMSYFSRVAKYRDLTAGVGLYRLVKHLEEHFEEEKAELIRILSELQKRIFARGRLLISLTVDAEGEKKVGELLPEFLSRLPENPCRERAALSLTKKNEGLFDASQVQYVACAGNFRREKLPYVGTLRILKTILSYDYLWMNVRVKGGAYGVMSGFLRNGDTYFVSYRDPNLRSTIEVFQGVPEYVRNFDASERDMTKYIIGTVSSLDTPLNPDAKGVRSTMAYITGIGEEDLQRERDEVLSADTEDIRALSPYIEAALSEGALCAIGNELVIEKEKDLFKVTESLL